MYQGFKIDKVGENRTVLKQQGKWISDRLDQNARIKIDISNIFDSPADSNPITREHIEKLAESVVEQHRKLKAGRGDCLDNGIPMLGWQSLPEEISDERLRRIQDAADELAEKIDAYISLGIGGSYLGIEAVGKALTHTYWNQLTRDERGGRPEVYFLGQNLDPDFLRDTLDALRGKRVGINVISKSGTTTETAVVFRLMRNLLENQIGARASDYIIATTDKEKGALRQLAEDKGYRTFDVPDNIGGRFSVLSDVGLLGLAVMGLDIISFVDGFKDMKRITDTDDFLNNPAMVHAAVRHSACANGKKVEVIASNSAAIYHIGRWMEQLFPESEGHKGKGLWISPSLYTEKLHANGQMVQEGERNILETFLLLEEHDNTIEIPPDADNRDGLNFLPDGGKNLNELNRLAMVGTAYAHYLGGAPNMTIHIPARNEYYIGQLLFMMERSVAISGYLLGHNPFIQPGVESYKKAMFALAGKPGYEKEGEKIREELGRKKKFIV